MNTYLTQFIKPELLILVPVLYAAGMLLKRSRVRDFNIPLILGVIGIVLSTIWVISTSFDFGWQAVLMELFTGITQGILTAAVSVYVSQLFKQGQEAQACRICEASKKEAHCTPDDDQGDNEEKAEATGKDQK